MLAWFLAKRFQRAGQQDQFLGFVSLAATGGIALGCFALILLLSVMNGFERELKQRILAVVPHGDLYAVDSEGIRAWHLHRQQLLTHDGVKQVSPYVRIEGLILQGTGLSPVQITGLTEEDIADTWSAFISVDALAALENTANPLLLGQGLMRKHGLVVGDSLQVIVPNPTNSSAFKAPRTLTYTLVGALSIGGDIDYQIAVTSLHTAVEQMGVSHGAQGLRFMFDNPFAAPTLMRQIGYNFPQAAYMSDWTRTHGHLYQDIQLVRTVVYIVLALVIAVACFNIVSTLVMAVRDKHREIAILRSMGANDGLIRSTFMLQGLATGVTGTLSGTLMALLVVPQLPNAIKALEALLQIELLAGDVYFVDFLPVEIQTTDVITTMFIAITLSLLATLYPARQAVTLSPAQAVGNA